MAREGLRTLVFASKRLTPQAYQTWLLSYNEARAAIHNRDERVRAALEELETDLEVGSLLRFFFFFLDLFAHHERRAGPGSDRRGGQAARGGAKHAGDPAQRWDQGVDVDW